MRKLAVLVVLAFCCLLIPSAKAQTVVYSNGFTSQANINANWCNLGSASCGSSASLTAVTCPTGAGFTLTTCAQMTVAQGSGSGQEGSYLVVPCFNGATSGCGPNGFNLAALTDYYVYEEIEFSPGTDFGAAGNNFKLIYNKNSNGGSVGVCYYDGIINSESPLNVAMRVICDEYDQNPGYVNVNLSTGTSHKIEEHYVVGGLFTIWFDGTLIGSYPSGMNLASQAMTDAQIGLYLNGEAGTSFTMTMSNFQICTGGRCPSGGGTPTPNPVFSPTGVAFGSVAVGSSSSPQTVLLTNSGTATLTGMSTPAITGDTTDFLKNSSTCGATLVAGSSCNIITTFSPMSSGAKSASITITTTNAGTLTVPLTGTGTSAPTATLSPTTWAFGTVPVGTNSASHTFVLDNTGTGPLTFSGVSIVEAGMGSQLFTPTGPETWPTSTWADWGGGPPGGGAAPAGGMATTNSKTTGGAPYSATVQHVNGTGQLAWAETYFGDFDGAATQQTDITYEEDVWMDSNATFNVSGGGGTKVNILICNQDFTNIYPEPLDYAPYYMTLYINGNSGDFGQVWGELHSKTHTPDTYTEVGPNTSFSGVLPLGQWVHLKVRSKLNTPGVGTSDGIFQVWMNGNQIINVSNLNYRDNYTMRGLNDFQITGYDNAPPTTTWNQYWDNPTVYATGITGSDFSILSNGCSSPLAGMGMCNIIAQFNPTVLGALSGTLEVTGANFGSGTISSAISGTGGTSGTSPAPPTGLQASPF